MRTKASEWSVATLGDPEQVYAPGEFGFYSQVTDHLVGGDRRCAIVIHASGNTLTAACTWHTQHIATVTLEPEESATVKRLRDTFAGSGEQPPF